MQIFMFLYGQLVTKHFFYMVLCIHVIQKGKKNAALIIYKTQAGYKCTEITHTLRIHIYLYTEDPRTQVCKRERKNRSGYTFKNMLLNFNI